MSEQISDMERLGQRLKLVFENAGLDYKAAGEFLGANEQRIKNLTRGRVKSGLRRSEVETLIARFDLREKWLATGEGEPYLSDGERRLQSQLDALKDITLRLQQSALPGNIKPDLQSLFYGVFTSNETIIVAALKSLANHYKLNEK